jgi:putative tryptophan/tyrosine transport system ATP-binding protein
MLQLRNIQKSFNSNSMNELNLFDNFNLEIEEGEFVVILGSNGSGKSTLLNLIDGQLSVDEGSILFLDQNMTSLPSFKRRQVMSRVFQDPALGTSPSLTILQNMSLALNKGKPFNLSPGVDVLMKENIRSYVSMLQLGLEDKLDVKVSHLSGGQRQALSLLMAVCSKPKLLLLDEHTAALDPKTSQHMIKLTQQLIEKFDMTTIMITHQIKDALEYGSRCIMLHEGNIVLDVKEDEKKSLQPQDLLTRFHSLTLV